MGAGNIAGLVMKGLEMLFDLADDPRECKDLSELPEYKAERDRLRGALRDHLAKHNDRHVVDGELTVQPVKWPVEDSRFGDKGMHRGLNARWLLLAH